MVTAAGLVKTEYVISGKKCYKKLVSPALAMNIIEDEHLRKKSF
jgi:hypothetical protein